MSTSLFYDGRALPARGRPPTTWPLATPSRRPWSVAAGRIFHGEVEVLWSPARPGPALDAALEIARCAMLHRLPQPEREALAEALEPLLAAPLPEADVWAALQVDGLRAAVAAAIRALQVPVSTAPPADAPVAAALLADAVGLAGGSMPSAIDEAFVEYADWLLSPEPAYTMQEDRYELTWEDVGLLWCGLARCAHPDGFPWLRSGLVILHECSPDGPRISTNARAALRRVLSGYPRQTLFEAWQDAICEVLEDIRAADQRSRQLATVVVRDEAAPVRLMLSGPQAEELSLDDAEVREAVRSVAGWFPGAQQAGALPGTAFRAARRIVMAADRGVAAAAEGVLGVAVMEADEELSRGRWAGRSLPAPLIGPLRVCLLQRVDHVDDLLALTEALQLLRSMSPESWLEGLTGFVQPWTLPIRWRALPRFLRSRGHHGAWRVAGRACHPAHLLELALQGIPEADRAPCAARLLTAEVVADLAAAGSGPITALGPVEVELTTAVTTAHALVYDGQWFVDTVGRLVPGMADPAWCVVHIDPAGTLEVRRVVEPWPDAVSLEPGDPVRLLDSRSATLTEVHARGCRVNLEEEGQIVFRDARAHTLQPDQPPAHGRNREVAWRRWLDRPMHAPVDEA